MLVQSDRDTRPRVIAVEMATDLDPLGEHPLLEQLQRCAGIEEHEVALRISTIQPQAIERRVHFRTVADECSARRL